MNNASTETDLLPDLCDVQSVYYFPLQITPLKYQKLLATLIDLDRRLTRILLTDEPTTFEQQAIFWAEENERFKKGQAKLPLLVWLQENQHTNISLDVLIQACFSRLQGEPALESAVGSGHWFSQTYLQLICPDATSKDASNALIKSLHELHLLWHWPVLIQKTYFSMCAHGYLQSSAEFQAIIKNPDDIVTPYRDALNIATQNGAQAIKTLQNAPSTHLQDFRPMVAIFNTFKHLAKKRLDNTSPLEPVTLPAPLKLWWRTFLSW